MSTDSLRLKLRSVADELDEEARTTKLCGESLREVAGLLATEHADCDSRAATIADLRAEVERVTHESKQWHDVAVSERSHSDAHIAALLRLLKHLRYKLWVGCLDDMWFVRVQDDRSNDFHRTGKRDRLRDALCDAIDWIVAHPVAPVAPGGDGAAETDLRARIANLGAEVERLKANERRLADRVVMAEMLPLDTDDAAGTDLRARIDHLEAECCRYRNDVADLHDKLRASEANVKRITGERDATRAEIERLQNDVASLRHEVSRLQSLASTAADLLEVEEIKREIVEAGGSWHSYCAVGCVHPVSIYDDKHYANFGTKGQPATLADWHAALAWLRGVTAPKPETVPPAERLSEPIDGMSAERCAEVAAEAGLGCATWHDKPHGAWTALWRSEGRWRSASGWKDVVGAAHGAIRSAARHANLTRRDPSGRECVLLPPLANEEGAD